MKFPRHLHRCRPQRGAAARGVLVALGVVAAILLQVGGARLQGRLASLVGLRPAASSAPSPMPPRSRGVQISQAVALATCTGHPPVL